MNRTMMAITFANFLAHVGVGADGKIVKGYYFGHWGTEDRLEPFCLTAHGMLEANPERQLPTLKISFPEPLEQGAEVSIQQVFRWSEGTAKFKKPLSKLATIEPHHCKIVRIFSKTLERPQYGETLHDFNFELILDRSGRKLAGTTGFGWKGSITKSEERRSFIVSEDNMIYFGSSEKCDAKKLCKVKFPASSLNLNDIIHIDEDDRISAYRILNMAEV